jgi:hypothetical protein
MRLFKVTTLRSTESFIMAENLKDAEASIKVAIDIDGYRNSPDVISGNIVEVTKHNAKNVLDQFVFHPSTPDFDWVTTVKDALGWIEERK